MKGKLINVLTYLLIIIFVVFFSYNFLSTSFSKVTVTPATPEFYVNDFADVISAKEESWMVERAKVFYEEYGCQIVISTIISTTNHSIENYIAEMFKQYEISDFGLLILYCKEDNKAFIKVGESLNPYITNSIGVYFVKQNFKGYQTQDILDISFRNLQKDLIDEISSRIDFARRYPNLVRTKTD